MFTLRVCAAMVCWLALTPAMVFAQTASGGLLDQMYNLFVNSVVIARTPGGTGVIAHEPIFANDPTVTAVTGLISQISQQIGSQVANFPLGSSAGGFTYSYDPALGTFSRTTESFGPAFAERAVTIGKGKFSVGVNYVHARYDSIDGRSLEDGDIKFYLIHQPLNPPSYVQGDVIEAALKMKLTTSTTAFLANYGITDRLDVGVAIPLVRTSMDLTYHATIRDFATRVVSPTTHVFSDGTKQRDFTSEGSAAGIGDVILRSKYVLLRRGAQGVAAGLDLSLPTGNELDMLGSGVTQTRLFFISSGVVGSRISPHVNVGYTLASGENGNDQFGYVGGVEVMMTPRATFVGDILGRTYRNALRLGDISFTQRFQQGPSAPQETTTLDTISVTSKSLASILGSAGVKFNPGQNFLISAHLLFPLSDAGLRTRITPVIGFDITF